MRPIRLAAAVLAIVAVPSAANEAPALLSAAMVAHAAQDHVRAARLFRALADEGSAIGETMLGAAYARGDGVRRDPAAAAACYFRAGQRGYAPAQLALSQALARGEGVARDRRAALVWARLAAQRGDARTATAARGQVAALQAVGAGDVEAEVADWRPWPSGRD